MENEKLREDVQTCRMFDITLDELKSGDSKKVCYACGYDAEDLVREIKRKDFQIKGLVEIYVKDKISFAVEQLENVKGWCQENAIQCFYNEAETEIKEKHIVVDKPQENGSPSLIKYFDNQIKQLKEGK